MKTNKHNDFSGYGELVRQKRRESKMTEEALAERIDMSDREVRNIENGTTIPKLDTVMKIGDVLDMDLGDLNVLGVTKELV